MSPEGPGSTPPGPSPPELVILVGLQGSGKSTFYRERFASTHSLASMDLYSPSSRNRRKRLLREVAEHLAAGRSVVADNTQPTAADRAPLVALARAAGARVVGFYLASPVADCLRRNAAREGAARVPDVALLATAKKLEPPSLTEGFDRLSRVSIGQPSGFVVEPLG